MHPPYDWTKQHKVDWTSEWGIQQLHNILEPALPYKPKLFQLQSTARLLMGDDVLCISATGDGKSALMYMYTLVRKGTMAAVVSPTNFLESDMVKNFDSLHIPAIAINSETMAAANLRSSRCDLWAEAASGRYQVVLFSPETLGTHPFRSFIDNVNVRIRLGLFCVDECHLVDEWGKDFRKAYSEISYIRSRLPVHTSVLGLTATLEPGRQTETMVSSIGFAKGAFHLDRRDCERENIDIIIRPILYTTSTHSFRDLDWLVPSNITKASDIPKTLVYCETIELGHRLALYLRRLLPASPRKDGRRLIRHMHSLICPECKREGLASLYQSGQDRETGIHIATEVLGAGINVRDYVRVVCFPASLSISAMVQHIGRAVRDPNLQGEAFVYIKKSDIDAVAMYLKNTDPAKLDKRLLPTKHPSGDFSLDNGRATDKSESTVMLASLEDADCQLDVAAEGHVDVVAKEHVDKTSEACGNGSDVDSQEDSYLKERVDHDVNEQIVTALDTIVGVPAGQAVRADTIKKVKEKMKGATESETEAGASESFKSMQLVIAAHLRGACITRQLNIIYHNPQTLWDCGRCSSCKPRPVPEPQPLQSDPSFVPSGPDSTKTYMKLKGKDLKYITARLNDAVVQIVSGAPPHVDSLFLGAKCVLTPGTIQCITDKFHLVISKEVLALRLKNWSYWDEYGVALWEVVRRLGTEMREKLEARHKQELARKRAANRRRRLAAMGFPNIKRVLLRVSEPSTTILPNHSTSADTKENHPPLVATSSLSLTELSRVNTGSSTRVTRKRAHSDLHSEQPLQKSKL